MKLSRTARRGLCWLYAAGMTAAMMLFVLLCTDVRYVTNDDAAILSSFVGAGTGTPAHFHIFIHGLVAWPLHWLSCAFPALPWFTYVQLGLLALGCLVIAKSVMQCFVNEDRPLWAGALLALAFVLVLCMKHVTRMTFTQTAAILGAAAVLQILSARHDRGGWRVVMSMLGAACLFALGYALRQDALWPLLALCGLAFVIVFARHYDFSRRALPMLISLAVVLASAAGLVGWRSAELSASGAQDYLAWQEIRPAVTDYYNLSSLPEEALAVAGWSEETVNLANSWCFLDPDLSTESFTALKNYLEEHDTRTFGDRVSAAQTVLATAMRQNALDMRCLLLGGAVLLLALAGACLSRRFVLAGGLAAALLLSGAMLAYLAYQGRLPLRAILLAVLPAAAIAFALLPACLPKKGGRALMSLCCAVCVGYGAWCLCDVVPQLLPNEQLELELGSAMGDLEEYASWEPESLFLFDNTLVGADLRAFPDYSEGVPNNLAFWGGWGLRSPESVEQFANFGIDLMNFDPETLLREDVYIASGRLDPPPTVLWNWLKAKLGPDVECEMWGENGTVYIFHFFRY